ncbi:MAG: MotA/TolQ/ExbB proton channel family protein [Spirochaetales bacterium]|nr:MotA/TolQ/ExbB proton channel family protein [Spirochaetales bacterium]
MTKLKFIIGIVFILFLIALGFFMSGNSLALIVDLISFVVAVVAPYILITFTYSPAEQIRMTGEILSNDGSADKKILNQGLAYLASLKSMIIISGILWTLLGGIAILANMTDPDSIGPNFSVALITFIYSLVYILAVIEPLKASAEKKLVSEE